MIPFCLLNKNIIKDVEIENMYNIVMSVAFTTHFSRLIRKK